MVRNTVEETLNVMLDAEADRLGGTCEVGPYVKRNEFGLEYSVQRFDP